MLKPLKRQADRIEAFWDDWHGTPPDQPLRRARRDGEVAIHRRRVDPQRRIQPEGSGVRHTARKVDDVAEQNAAEHVDLANQIIAVKTEVQRWHASKEKP